MKKCPFCAEEIQDEAIKCRHCSEFLDGSYKPRPKTKWYYNNSAIVIGLVTLGPLALPLVWKNPNYKVVTKTVVTIAVIIGTIWLCYLMGKLVQDSMQKLNDLGL